MAQFQISKTPIYPERRLSLLYPVAILWGLTVAALAGFFFFESGFGGSTDKYYLLPWCFLTGGVIAAPSVYLYFKKKFDLFHPLVFAAWSYFFPAFFLGGLILATGFSNPYFLNFINDERNDLPLTLIYVMLGYGGLSVGFFLPFGRRIGDFISRRLPAVDWTPEQVIKPGLVLLALGLANTIFAFAVGLLGYQRVEEIGLFDGVLFLITFFWLEATFLLWLCLFRIERLNFTHYLVIAVLLVTSLTKSAFQGNRGSLIQLFILVSFAFVMSGRKIEFRHKAWGGVLLAGALIVGMIYGTTFRNVKTTEEKMSFDQYAGVVFETFEKLSEQDMLTALETGFTALAERFENVSSLAVVVSNYEKLAPYEASYGLDNNIMKDSVAFLIPRFIWPEKPISIDPYKYGDLYFNFNENAFALTPMGDLLRNFGPVGVPLGMIFLGFVIRIMYSSLRENQGFSIWRITLFYMLLTGISYEGSFGLIIPYDIKIGLVSVLGLFVVWLFAGGLKRTGGEPVR